MWMLFLFVLLLTGFIGKVMVELARKITQFLDLNSKDREIVKKEVDPIHRLFIGILFCIWTVASSLFLIMISKGIN
jgi:hypothetical protein